MAAVRQRPEERIRNIGQQTEPHAPGPAERLLAEAFVLFYSKGIRSAGIDLVISRAGVAKASFYRHYATKAELIVAYLDRRQDAWLVWLQEDVASRSRRADRQLLAIFDALADLFVDEGFRGSALVNAVAEVGEEHPQVIERALDHRDRLRSYVVDLGKAARCKRPADMADEWMLLIDGAMVAGHLARDPAPARSAKKAAERLLRHYLA